jgi:hypothetical protein
MADTYQNKTKQNKTQPFADWWKRCKMSVFGQPALLPAKRSGMGEIPGARPR